MTIVYAVLFGMVQGLTEFLPVSSSGHLVLLHDVLRLPEINNLGFDVALHLGTALALVIYFFKEYLAMARMADAASRRMAGWIAIGTVPAAIAGYLYADVIESVLHTPLIVASTLITVGLLLLAVEHMDSVFAHSQPLDTMTWKHSLVIGCAQALALIPGVSRSGATILAGMGLGLDRAAAARFSFLLSVPIIVAAGAKELIGLPVGQVDWILYVIGAISSAVTGYIALHYFLRFVATRRLDIFAWYRIVLGSVVLIWLAF